jgi:hypothetical protein
VGVYTYSVPITPLTSGGGTTSGDLKIPGIPGKWTASTVSGSGVYTGSIHPSVGLIFEGFGLPGGWEDFYTVTAAGGSFSFTNQVSGHAASAYSQALGGFDIRFAGTAWTSITLQNLSFTLTGTPFGNPIPPGPLVRLLPTILGNLYFEDSPGYPLDQEPEADAPIFDDPTLGPGSFETIWTPDGYITIPKPGTFATDRVRGRKRMACLRLKGGVYINIGPSNLPAIMQVSLPGDSQWLKFTPGLANLGASAGNGNIGVRIYKGTGRFATGVWTTGYTALSQAPDWCGNGSFADLFPWESALTFMVELTGIAATIPASSLFEFRFDGFDLS